MEGSGLSAPVSHHDFTYSNDIGDSDIEDDEEAVEDDAEHPPAETQAQGMQARTDATPLTVRTLSEEPDPDTEGPPRKNPRLSLPSSPQVKPGLSLSQSMSTLAPAPGPNKIQVVVRDSSYWTYRAMLNYVGSQSYRIPVYRADQS
jgi:hypothetical protein